MNTLKSLLVLTVTILFFITVSTGCDIFKPEPFPKPTVNLPSGYNQEDLVVVESSQGVPNPLNFHYVPLGKVYDISINGIDNVDFGSEYAQIVFSYSKDELNKRGLLEEFAVFYYDNPTSSWKPVNKITVDYENMQVIAYTNHFTPFVFTAIPSASGTVADPPACISDDFPAGIGGSGNAVFTVVDNNFKYYQDRDYYIRSTDVSAENTATFSALGLDGSLGISTANGGSAYGTVAEHKLFTGDDYILFTAHADLDVYIMYDTRGGTDRSDTSGDAPWLTSTGFVNTGYFLETTDAVQFYSVYHKPYLQGESVQLHGNRKNVTDPGVNTNYWVILKRMGDVTSGQASGLCETSPDTTPPSLITYLKAIPGETTVALTWQNPDDTDFAGVVIRRSDVSPPMGVQDGDEPTGTVITPQSYRDNGLASNTTYYYTVFSLDTNNNYLLGETVAVTTETDSDGDGLADSYETATEYAPGVYTDWNLSDTDGDGISDGDEVALGTDPTNADVVIPTITQFLVTSDNPNDESLVTFTLNGTDDTTISCWMVTLTDGKPLAGNSAWNTIKPVDYTLPIEIGTYDLYAWARDSAGNVSDSQTVTVVIGPSLCGIVRDSFGTPIEGALVRLYNAGFSEYMVSDDTGYYEYLFVPDGTYNLVADRDGFSIFTTVVVLN